MVVLDQGLQDLLADQEVLVEVEEINILLVLVLRVLAKIIQGQINKDFLVVQVQLQTTGVAAEAVEQELLVLKTHLVDLVVEENKFQQHLEIQHHYLDQLVVV